MAVLGRVLISSAERVDLPDLLSIDSYVAGDFKFLLKGLVGDNKPFVLKGFDIIDPSTAIGTQSCSVNVADSVVFYPGSNAGSFFHGLESGNPQAAPLVPELRKNATNFVYLTFSTYNTSVDTRAFWDPDKGGGAGGEFTQDVNTESVLKVDINVSTGSFPANTIPIAKVVVGPVVITSITDCRDMMFRLGSGGISPDPFANYQFRSLPSSSYKRTEPPITMLPGGDNPFQGGDKNILSLKEWMDLVMTKFKELSGTQYWYEDLSTYSLISGFVDACATTFKSKGKWQHSSAVPGQVTWTEDIQIKVTQDPRDLIIRAGSKTLANEEVAYIDLVRNQPINPTDSAVSWTNGQSYINTVGGATGFFTYLQQGDWIKKANDHNHLFLRVEEFYDSVNLGGSVTTPVNARSVRLSAPYQGTTIVEKARYDRGVYTQTDVIQSTREVAALTAAGGNFHWIATRSDVIENIANIGTVSLSGSITEADGSIVKVVSTAHGLINGDRITVASPALYAGTYVVEIQDVDTFHIQSTHTSLGAFTAYYGLATTASRDNGYGLVLESATHEFETDDTVFISSTTNYNGSYQVSVRSSTQFQFAISAAHAGEITGQATLSRVNVRAEQGLLKVIQGESSTIGNSSSDNITSFIGMGSNSETYPIYNVPSSYSAIAGMSSYGSSTVDNLTARASKLTAMMADKAQDKTIKYLPSGTLTTITNTTNGSAQEVTFDSGSTLTLITPGTAGTATISLPSASPGISLATNQVAYVVINRNAASTPSIAVSAISAAPIAENVFVIASRLSTTDVYLWDGSIIHTGSVPAQGFLDDVVRQNQMLKLVEGGTWAWNLGTQTLTWSASAYIQVPGLANSANSIAAGSISLTSGQVAYVDISRAGAGGALTVSVAANSSLTLGTNRIIIARRESSDVIVGNHSMRLVDGESKKLYAGVSDQLLSFMGASGNANSQPDYNGALAHTLRYIVENSSLETATSTLDDQIDKLFGQLRLRAKSPTSSRVIITGADRILLDNTTISSQLKNLLLKFDGAEIDFQTGAVYASDGLTSLGFNFTPASISPSLYRWYSVSLIPSTLGLDNRITAKVQVIQGTSDGSSTSTAPAAPFASSGLKLGQVAVQNSATPGIINSIPQANIIQLNTGSGGSNDADPGNIYEEHVDVVSVPSGNNQMAAISAPPVVVVLPKDTNKLVGTSVIASTDGSTATVSVLKLSHGLTTGDTVTVTTTAAIGGISAVNLSVTSATITVVDTNTFTYVATASSTSVASGYLDRVIAKTIKNFIAGDGSLQVYLNGIYLRKGDDFTEIGAPGTASNAVYINIKVVIGDVLTYRVNGQQTISGASTSSGGGGGSTSLQGAYNNGNVIAVSSGVPVAITGPVGQKLLEVFGDVEVTGIVDPTGLTLSREASNPIPAGQDGLWNNASGELIFTKDGSGDTNIITSIIQAAQPFKLSSQMANTSGTTITQFYPVYIDTNGNAAVIDVSIESNAKGIVGVASGTIGNNSSGEVITYGVLANIGASFSFGDILYVGKDGSLTNVVPDIGTGSPAFVAGDFVVKVGTVMKNLSAPTQRDLVLNIQVMGQLA